MIFTARRSIYLHSEELHYLNLTKYSKGKQISVYSGVCDAHGVASLTRDLEGESIHLVSCPRLPV